MEDKTADELFEEAGYKKKFEGLYEINYQSRDGRIKFNKVHRIVEIYKYEDDDFIDMPELQAINKKVEELGWI